MEIIRNLWYMFRRFKLATALNFLGLTIAFAAFYIFMTQVDYNLSYNRGIKDYKRIYRLEMSSFQTDFETFDMYCSRPIAEHIEGLPQVETVSCYQAYPQGWGAKKNGVDIMLSFTVGSKKALSAFSPKCLDGKLEWTDKEQDGVLIPASMAKMYFDEVQVAGKYFFDGEDSVLVRGVYEDFPENTTIRNIMYSYWYDQNANNPNNQNYVCFVKLRPDANVSEVEKLIIETEYKLYKERMAQYETSAENLAKMDEIFSKRKARLHAIGETYFSGVDSEFDKGNKGMLLILELACLLIIVVAGINFLNFTLAESPMRIRGINTRRVMGKGLAVLRAELVAEAVLVSLLAFAVGMGIVYLLSLYPAAMSLVQGDISLHQHWWLLGLTGGVSLLVGISAGLYPALYATSFAPALVLKGSFGLSPKGKQLRMVLVALQLAVSCFVVFYLGVLYLQSRYIYNSDYGFDKDQVYYARLDHQRLEKFDEVVARVKAVSGVERVSRSNFVLGTSDGYMSWARSDADHQIYANVLPVDEEYLRTMGIEVVAGRDFTTHDGDVYIINEAARRKWPWVEVGQPLLDEEFPVLGVCENVRFGTVRQDNADMPLMFVLFGERFKAGGWGLGNVINIRVSAGVDKVKVRRMLEEAINSTEGMGHVDVTFLNRELENTYQEEFRFVSQVIIFSAICLLITLIGVFCLTMFETEYRRKEIGIRKIMGASACGILGMLCRKYSVLIVIALAVSIPAAWYAGEGWLENFAERTAIPWWLPLVSLGIVSGITLLTVIVQAWKTANDNPINSIKTE